MTLRVEDMPAAPDRRAAPRQHPARRRRAAAPCRLPVGAACRIESRSTMAARTCSRSRSSRRRSELTLANNRAVVVDQRRARPAARAAGLGRAACRRADLAQPAEVRPGGRPGAFHHPAPAREAGRHADPRAVADRLPDPRAVRGQARRVRPDHLRPLSPARRAAALYLENIARYVEQGRRAAGSGRRRASARRCSLFRTPLGEVLPAEPTGQVHRGGLQAAAHRSRAAPSGHRGPARRRRGRRQPQLGPLVPPGRRGVHAAAAPS